MTIGRFFHGLLEPDEIIGGCINVYENAWPNPEETIKLIESITTDPDSGIHWSKAMTFGQGLNQTARTNYDLGITANAKVYNNAGLQNIHNQMYVLLSSSLAAYRKRYGIEEDLWHEPYNMLKYSGGQEYKAHYDGNTSIKRCVSAIVYLNNDYEGGHVEFTNFGIKIKPEPGMLLLFPSNYAYTHIAHPVTSGTKYAIVTWTHDQYLEV
jgi:hypothetical protein